MSVEDFTLFLHGEEDTEVETTDVEEVEEFEPNDLTIFKQETIFNDMTFKETITKEAINLYHSNQLSDDEYKKQDLPEHLNTDRKILNNYVEKSKNNIVKVTYNMSKGIKWGRVFPKNHLSIGIMKRAVRYSIAYDCYTDIDIVNCHPVILLQICKKNKIECSKLEYYINNREKVLSQFMNATGLVRDDAKEFMIILMYGGSVYGYCRQHKIKCMLPYYFKAFEKETKAIFKAIIESNLELAKDLKEVRKKDYNFDGSVSSYYLQEFERRILERVYTFFKKRGIIVDNDCILSFDGIMVNKARFENADKNILRDLEAYIDKKLGFKLKFDTKEMKPVYDVSEQAGQLRISDNAKKELNKLVENVTLEQGDNLLLEILKKNNSEAYDEFVDKHLSLKFKTPKMLETTQFKACLNLDQQYITKDKKVDTFVNDYLKSDTKVMCIKSAYGTGKTTLIKDICDKYKRVLFVSYRVTLALNIEGTFNGFENYTNNVFDANKQIIQLDSIVKLKNVKFDCIILDEIEGSLNHLNAKTLLEKRKDSAVPKFVEIFDHLLLACKASKKVIMLDGDIDDRSIVFAKAINGNSSFYFMSNIFKGQTYNLKFHHNSDQYNELLDTEMKAKKKVCLISMGQSTLEDYHTKYSETNDIKFYTGNSDDIDKKKLVNIKQEWKGKNTSVFFSPTIEAGVDYNADNDNETFNSCFIILSNQSTSQRGLSQMMKRIRQFKNKTIHVLLNNVPYSDKYNRYQTYNETKAYYKVIKRDSVQIDDDGNILDNNTMKLIDIIQCYNKTEEVNKKPFLPKFIEMMINNGHTIEEFDDNTNKKDKNKMKDNKTVYIKVCCQDDITEVEKDEITARVKAKNATTDDKYKLMKYWIQETSMTQLNEDTTIKQYNDAVKTKNSVYNTMDLIKGETKSNNMFKQQRLKHFKSIIDKLSIDIHNKTILPRDKLLEHMDVIKTITKQNYLSFGMNKGDSDDIHNKNISYFIKNQLEYYGFDMTTERITEREGNETKTNTYYHVSMNKNIKHVIDTKNEILNEIKQMEQYMPDSRIF